MFKNFQNKMLTYLSFEHADFTIIHNSFSKSFKNLPYKMLQNLCTCKFKLHPVFLLNFFNNNPSFVCFINQGLTFADNNA